MLHYRPLDVMSKRRIREAADGITRIFKDLSSRGMTRYLPSASITCIIPAMAAHLSDLADAKSTDNSTKDCTVQKFQLCLRVLQQLREVCPSTICVSDLWR